MGTVERLEILKDKLPKHYDTDIVNNLLKRISDLEFEVERLTCDNESLSSNNSKLAKIILEAIDYIEKTPLVKGTEYYRIQLLDILKGEDKE